MSCTFPSPGDLPDPRIKRGSPALRAYTLPSEPPDNGEMVAKEQGQFAFKRFPLYLLVKKEKVIKGASPRRKRPPYRYFLFPQ